MKLIRVLLLAIVAGGLVTLASCGSKDPAPAAPTVSFTNSTATYAEDKGTINVEVTLSSKISSDASIDFSVASPDTTAYNGPNYTVVTPSPLIIAAGQTTGNIQIKIVDDVLIDGDNDLKITLTGAGTNAKLGTTANTAFDLTITDNDTAPTDAMQIDLYWFGTNVNAAASTHDLDLYLQQNVVSRDTTINGEQTSYLKSQGTPYKKSSSTTNFETLTLLSTDTQQQYYIFVPYFAGTGSVTFYFALNGLGRDHDYLGATFTASDAPPDRSHARFYYFGPFALKDGVFDFSDGRVISNAKNAKLIKGTNFFKEQ